MVTNRPRACKELTSDCLFTLLAGLPEEVEADAELIKRTCCRWLLRAPAELSFQDGGGASVREYISIRDISLAGAGMICKTPLPPGTRAELVLPLEDGDYKVGVRIAHCTQTVGGFKIGAALLLPDAPARVPVIHRALLTREEYERNGR